MGASPWPARSAPKVGGQVRAVVGDAGGSVNPFNGEGIDYAYETGRMVAGLLGEALRTGDGMALQQLPPAWLGRRYGLYFKVARLFANVIGQPVLMRELTRVGMRSRSLMDWVLRIMANLLRPDELGPAEAAYKMAAAAIVLRPGPSVTDLPRIGRPATRGLAVRASPPSGAATRSARQLSPCGVGPEGDPHPARRPWPSTATAFADDLVDGREPGAAESPRHRRHRPGRSGTAVVPGGLGPAGGWPREPLTYAPRPLRRRSCAVSTLVSGVTSRSSWFAPSPSWVYVRTRSVVTTSVISGALRHLLGGAPGLLPPAPTSTATASTGRWCWPPRSPVSAFA